VLILSVREADDEKVAALDAGADDYVTKPFSTAELLARLRVALRHARSRLPTATRQTQRRRRLHRPANDDGSDQSWTFSPRVFALLRIKFRRKSSPVAFQTQATLSRKGANFWRPAHLRAPKNTWPHAPFSDHCQKIPITIDVGAIKPCSD